MKDNVPNNDKVVDQCKFMDKWFQTPNESDD